MRVGVNRWRLLGGMTDQKNVEVCYFAKLDKKGNLADTAVWVSWGKPGFMREPVRAAGLVRDFEGAEGE